MTTPLRAPEMLAELGAVLASPEFERDPQGALHAWADVAAGRVTPTDYAGWPRAHGGDPAQFDDVEMVALGLAASGPIRNGDVRAAIGYTASPEAVRGALRRLCNLGLLERRGVGRGTRYVATPADR